MMHGIDSMETRYDRTAPPATTTTGGGGGDGNQAEAKPTTFNLRGGPGVFGGGMGRAWVVLGVSKDTPDRLLPLKAPSGCAVD